MLPGFKKDPRAEGRKRLGEILLGKALLTDRQLTDALKKAHQSGIRLGAALTLLGYVSEEQILKALSESLRVSFIDMNREVISIEAQARFPYDIVKTHTVVPVRLEGRDMIVAMTDPTDYWIVEDIRFRTNLSVKPVLASSHQLSDILKFFEQNGYARRPYDLARLKYVTEQARSLTMEDLLKDMVQRDASDLHLAVGAPPSVRVNDRLIRLDMPILDVQTAERFVNGLLTEEQKTSFSRNKELEITYMRDDIGRFRISLFRQRRSISVSVRNLRGEIPPLEELGFPKAVPEALLNQRGLVLVTSPSGHGKSTTIASMIDYLNRNAARNIITLEDPIEFLHKHKRCNVHQREVGEDTASFSSGLRHILRQNPDVIMIGEMRDAETVRTCLEAASTGPLVVTSMHATSTISALDTVMTSFSGKELQMVRQRMADSLLLAISQRLVPRKSGVGRVLAAEVLMSSPRVATLIREGRQHQIRTLTTGTGGDVVSLEACLADQCKKGLIQPPDAHRLAEDTKRLTNLLAAQ